MAPFVKLQAAERPTGKVSSFTGGWYGDGEAIGPYGGGSLSWWLQKNYEMMIMSGTNGVAVEGNLVLLDKALRLGIVHGIGGSLIHRGNGEGFDGHGMVTFGLFTQTSPARASALYAGTRGTLPFPGRRGFIDLAVGGITRSGALQYGPELIWNLVSSEVAGPALSLSMRLEAAF